MLAAYLRTAPEEYAGAVNLISDQIRDLIGDLAQDHIRCIDYIDSSISSGFEHGLDPGLETCVDAMSDRIERYVRVQGGLDEFPKYYSAEDVVGDAFVGMIHDPLKIHFHKRLIEMGVRRAASPDDMRTAIEDRFYAEIARFFSGRSTLLKPFWAPRYIPPDDDYISEAEDEEEELWEEYDPPDLIDVLAGPTNVLVTDVSAVVATTENSACTVYFDPHAVMRKLHSVCMSMVKNASHSSSRDIMLGGTSVLAVVRSSSRRRFAFF